MKKRVHTVYLTIDTTLRVKAIKVDQIIRHAHSIVDVGCRRVRAWSKTAKGYA